MQGQPIVFISHFAVKLGHAQALRAIWMDVIAGLRKEALAAGVSLTVEPDVLGGFLRASGR